MKKKRDTAGKKFDDGKNKIGEVLGIFPNAIWAVGEVGTHGAKKYSMMNALEVDDGINRYTNALYRHLTQEAMGEKNDTESGLLHASHTAWNALMRLELLLKEEFRK